MTQDTPPSGRPVNWVGAAPKHVSTTVEAISVEWAGPIPHPQILQGYREIVPDAPERILAMAEAEGAHVRRLQTIAAVTDSIAVVGGMLCSLLLCLVVIGAAVFLAVKGQPVLAGTLVTVALGTVAVAFIVGRKIQADAGRSD